MTLPPDAVRAASGAPTGRTSDHGDIPIGGLANDALAADQERLTRRATAEPALPRTRRTVDAGL
jgi:hypothetical protein